MLPYTPLILLFQNVIVIQSYIFVHSRSLSRPKSHACRAQPSSSTPQTDPTILALVGGAQLRGANYGTMNNSTIPSPEEIAQKLGVRPTESKATKGTWSRAWKLQKIMLPILHLFDSCKPPDSSLNLACMWWKALAGNDPTSPVFDHGLAYDMLPTFTRRIISKRLLHLYPRLHHANVELRTAFLDKVMDQVIQRITSNQSSNASSHVLFRVILLGAGYDTRSLKLLEKDYPHIQEIYDLDLPQVVSAKQKLIQKRILERRPWLREKNLPVMLPIDLNDLDGVRMLLLGLTGKDDKQPGGAAWHNIFVFEGVMIYLKEGVPQQLLNITSTVLKATGSHGTLCFADRLENIPGGDKEIAKRELLRNGWVLQEWNPKPGLARHMGSAEIYYDLRL
jgi:O-methyltransferase involved in polyketide biosynthesis